MATTEVIVGIIGRAHGIRGEVSVDLRTDEPERRYAPGLKLRIEDTTRTLTVEGARWHQDRLLVTFVEVPDRTVAETLRGVVLVTDVDADEVPHDEEEFYDRHLIGLRMLSHNGTQVGEVVAVQHLPIQDLLVVRTVSGQRLIPFTKAIVPTVDIAASTCQLADVPGLIDDSLAETADGK